MAKAKAKKPAKKVSAKKVKPTDTKAAKQRAKEKARYEKEEAQLKASQEKEKAEQLKLASPLPEVSEEDAKAAKKRVEETAEAVKAEVKRLAKLGLVEVDVRGTPYKLIGLADPKATPTIEQRVEMAKRLNAVGPKLPRYLGVIGHLIDEKKPHASTQAVVSVAKSIESGKEVEKKAAKQKAKEKAKPAPKGEAKKSAQPAAEKAGKKRSLEVPKVPKEGFSKTNKPATSGELIRARIMEHKLTDEQIAAEVRKLFEGRNTQVSDVRWNRGQLRKIGIDAPDPVGEEPQKGKKK